LHRIKSFEWRRSRRRRRRAYFFLSSIYLFRPTIGLPEMTVVAAMEEEEEEEKKGAEPTFLYSMD
jgi:hypothetical protein